jgi:hypothetical protein
VDLNSETVAFRYLRLHLLVQTCAQNNIVSKVLNVHSSHFTIDTGDYPGRMTSRNFVIFRG